MVDSSRSDSSILGERHPHEFKEIQGFVVGFSAGDDGDIHALLALDFVELDFRENGLIADTQGIIASAIKRTDRKSAKVSNSRKSGSH